MRLFFCAWCPTVLCLSSWVCGAYTMVRLTCIYHQPAHPPSLSSVIPSVANLFYVSLPFIEKRTHSPDPDSFFRHLSQYPFLNHISTQLRRKSVDSTCRPNRPLNITTVLPASESSSAPSIHPPSPSMTFHPLPLPPSIHHRPYHQPTTFVT